MADIYEMYKNMHTYLENDALSIAVTRESARLIAALSNMTFLNQGGIRAGERLLDDALRQYVSLQAAAMAAWQHSAGQSVRPVIDALKPSAHKYENWREIALMAIKSAARLSCAAADAYAIADGDVAKGSGQEFLNAYQDTCDYTRKTVLGYLQEDGRRGKLPEYNRSMQDMLEAKMQADIDAFVKAHSQS